ncbi:hypothetical protein Q5H92_17425 [Hymenobacter sp. M29]|uniref:Outer membrane protein assembly factor BamE n=1 Tax=Hymenobacter mellowenesis TaxID=3063995 RepID=A0ABT9AGT0_9BACT|nr:hypothetical protein [Hymenobacter sp. M29]MDO7848151.1 hypothetical protein [Hymenobacter sp. M29]
MSISKVAATMAWACIGILLFLILYANYDSYFSVNARLAKKNAKNIREIEVGMDSVRVNQIMGLPVGRYSIKQDHIFHYIHQPGTSNSYQIVFNAAYQVKEVGIID